MRIKNMTGDLYSRCWISISLRDLVVLGCCLVYEHYSLKAFWEVVRAWNRVWSKRRWIMERKRVSDDYIAAWFHYHPVSHPAHKRTRAIAAPGATAQAAEP